MEGKQQDPADKPPTKRCAHCGEERPLGEFQRRTGRRAGPNSRRGACRECRRRMKAGEAAAASAAGGPMRAEPGANDNSIRTASGANGGGSIGPASTPAMDKPMARDAAPAAADARSLSAERPDAGEAEEPERIPGSERRRKKRRGRRGGRKRYKRRRARADAAAAEPAVPAPERTDAPPAAEGPGSDDPGAAPPAGTPAAERRNLETREAGARKRKKATYFLPPLPPPPPRPEGPDPSVLSPGKSGVIWMRGRTDKGRRWRQETDLETAVTLVREYAAVVVNRRTIRRLYTNKAFREYILKRDNYTCYFCGKYGDTIDHIVPRAKGGHTTPLNCVTACRECNQSKAALDLEEFVERLPSRSGEPT